VKHFAFICLSFSGSNYFLPVHRLCKWNPASILGITAIFVGEWEGERGGQWPNYSALLEGREISIDLIHTPWPPLTHHFTAASFLRIIEIFVGEWEGGRGQWQLITVLCSPGRERSNYWFNSQPWPHTDSPFYGRRLIQQRKEGLHQILYCVHTYLWYCISMQEDTA
jgi:hypothetical protein